MRDAQVKLDYLLEIAVDDPKNIERLAGRRVHRGSGRTYHVRFNPPKAVCPVDVVAGQ